MASRTDPQFILLGDSIVQYASEFSNGGYEFGARLAQHCARRLDVVNRGLSGYTSSNILEILPELTPDPTRAKVDYVLLLCGANDACLPGASSGQHVPLDKYRKNLKAILSHPAITRHNPKVLLVTPPPVNEPHLESEDAKKGSLLSRTQANTSTYAQAVRDIADEFREQNVVLVDLWAGLLEEVSRLDQSSDAGVYSDGLRALLVDGLHLTGRAYKIFYDKVLPHVGASWAEEAFDSPSWIFPHWTKAPKYRG